MWMVDPSLLCRKHLLGEHVECHMFRGSLLKGKSVRGFLETGLLDSRKLARRHDQLAKEMLRRGYRHASPLPRDFDPKAAPGSVDVVEALRELASRCDECRELQSKSLSSPPGATTRRSRDVGRSNQ
jgi:cytosine/adenosine deaminase-related metal-dependent hydrolase